MAKTAAQRQADYRAQRAHPDSNERRLNTWINTDAFVALETLAERYGVTMRGVIEIVLKLELEKPRAINGLKAKATAGKPVSLSRNKLPKVAPVETPAPKTKKPRVEKLQRNKVVKAAEQPPKKRQASTDKPKPSRPSGTQFEFEL